MVLFDGDFRFWLQTGVLLVLVLAAWRWGRAPERAVAAILVGMRVADIILHQILPQAAPDALAFGHLAIDLAATLAAIGVALGANRTYTLWFAALQLIALLAHLAAEAAPGVATLAYRLLSTGPSYFQMCLLAGGIWLHHRRERTFGPYRSWRTSSHHSRETPRRDWRNG